MPTRKHREQVQLRAAAKWSHVEIAAELGVSRPTLELYFAEELLAGSSKKKGEALDMLWRSAKKGNVSAQKTLVVMMADTSARVGGGETKAKAVARLGKKEIAQQESEGAATGLYETPAPPAKGKDTVQ